MSGFTQTLDITDSGTTGDSQQVADGSEAAWGRLLPVAHGFVPCVLSNDCHTFGRDESAVDFCFTNTSHQCFSAFSKVHFIVKRENNGNNLHNVFLHDQSSNGTFINGEKVGKGQRHLLRPNDEIALAVKKNKVYIFMEAQQNEDESFPIEFREKYVVSKLLGAMGEVKQIFDKITWDTFAVKIVAKSRFTGRGENIVNNEKQINQEIEIMKALNHPCVASVKNVYDTAQNTFIVLELIKGGELFDRVIGVGHLSEEHAKLYCYQMVLAIKYLHDKGISHRDLKPENILLASDDDDTVVKVSDFGLSKFVDSGSMLKTFCGTPNYLAPEIVITAGSGSYTKAVDIWSLGVIMFICLGGYPPFSNDYKDMDLKEQITKPRYSFPKKYWGTFTQNAKDIIERMLTKEPEKRATADQLLAHPWLQDEEMKKKAHLLMYPLSDGMIPPQVQNSVSPAKKRVRSDRITQDVEMGDVPVADDGTPVKRSNMQQVE